MIARAERIKQPVPLIKKMLLTPLHPATTLLSVGLAEGEPLLMECYADFVARKAFDVVAEPSEWFNITFRVVL